MWYNLELFLYLSINISVSFPFLVYPTSKINKFVCFFNYIVNSLWKWFTLGSSRFGGLCLTVLSSRTTVNGTHYMMSWSAVSHTGINQHKRNMVSLSSRMIVTCKGCCRADSLFSCAFCFLKWRSHFRDTGLNVEMPSARLLMSHYAIWAQRVNGAVTALPVRDACSPWQWLHRVANRYKYDILWHTIYIHSLWL
jgi:hypothetical protein